MVAESMMLSISSCSNVTSFSSTRWAINSIDSSVKSASLTAFFRAAHRFEDETLAPYATSCSTKSIDPLLSATLTASSRSPLSKIVPLGSFSGLYSSSKSRISSWLYLAATDRRLATNMLTFRPEHFKRCLSTIICPPCAATVIAFTCSSKVASCIRRFDGERTSCLCPTLASLVLMRPHRFLDFPSPFEFPFGLGPSSSIFSSESSRLDRADEAPNAPSWSLSSTRKPRNCSTPQCNNSVIACSWALPLFSCRILINNV
mmetsp:Transcript_43218/g.69294  ORF Transcript_43218/g.69294 Transcript_43218/m.69294 type:complete len:260 (+) Transcript_43218:3881-4660(+)